MRGLITIALLMIVGRAAAGEQLIDVQHDSARGVTCWILNNTGISCLPDSSFLQAPASTTNSRTTKIRSPTIEKMRLAESTKTPPPASP